MEDFIINGIVKNLAFFVSEIHSIKYLQLGELATRCSGGIHWSVN